MHRWLLILGLWALVGVLAAFFWLGWQVVREGVPVRVAELRAPLPVEVENPVVLSSPLEVRVASLPWAVPEKFSVTVEGPVRAETGLLRCPRCGEGILLPVRVNLFSGAITWQCTACGAEFGP
ncbi:hypothetical protein H5T57_04795 [Candidatus Bipolaricaulota bacterium]|nr:hypothetical protein [Candidatus Bipolaricaulota bacterium]